MWCTRCVQYQRGKGICGYCIGLILRNCPLCLLLRLDSHEVKPPMGRKSNFCLSNHFPWMLRMMRILLSSHAVDHKDFQQLRSYLFHVMRYVSHENSILWCNKNGTRFQYIYVYRYETSNIFYMGQLTNQKVFLSKVNWRSLIFICQHKRVE